MFASETALRPCEFVALEWRDVDRAEGVVRVERTFTDGRAKSYVKTVRSRRSVPTSARALAALDGLTRRIDTRLVFPGTEGGFLNMGNWRRREWIPALEAAGLSTRPVYDLRHTAISTWLAAGLGLYEASRYAGTSVRMIDAVYGHLTRGSEAAARAKLDAYSDRLGRDRAAETEAE